MPSSTLDLTSDKYRKVIQDLINNYKNDVKINGIADELYKFKLIKQFQSIWDIDRPDFGAMIKSIDFGNLMFHISRATLNHMALEKPEELRQAFKLLYNEDQPLKDRIPGFLSSVKAIYDSIKGKEEYVLGQDERSVSVFLAFRYPDKYFLYKNSFYKALCETLSIERVAAGEKYLHYLDLATQIRDNYVVKDLELVDQIEKLKDEECYPDRTGTILTQDILYTMLEKRGQQKYKKILFKRIQEIGNRDLLEIYFSNLNKLFSDNNITEEDIKAFCTVRKDETSLKFTYGQRYVHNIRRDGDQFFFAYIVNDSDSVKYVDSDNVAKTDFSGSLPMKYVDVALDEHLNWPYENRSLISDCSKALGLEKERGKDFSFQKTFKESHNPLIYDMAMNEKLRNNVFDQILGVKAADGSVSVVEEDEIVFNAIESRNIILYGPPGTGKTYKTIDLSVKIIDGKDNGHVSNKKRFDELLQSGQIQFVTFHQNYSYEDFVVGLRPVENAGNLIFKRHEGIFYEICKRAEKNYLDYMKGEGSLTFDEVFQKYFEEALRGGGKEIVMSSGVSFKVYDITDTTIRFEKNTGDRQHSLSISTLSDIYHGRRELIGGLKYYYDPIVRDLRSISSNKDKVNLRNYVLIIDEINRANISKVFGELITLIEEDKRMGGANELRVTLPNGERNFSIPPNLYIIGTMNTADKSISQIDIALRRRFEFQAENPKPELLSRVQADFLNAVNKEILEYKRSTDFLIGHGYFMGKTGVLAEDIIEFRIKPLLNEYFPGRADIVDSILKKALRNDSDVSI